MTQTNLTLEVTHLLPMKTTNDQTMGESKDCFILWLLLKSLTEILRKILAVQWKIRTSRRRHEREVTWNDMEDEVSAVLKLG